MKIEIGLPTEGGKHMFENVTHISRSIEQTLFGFRSSPLVFGEVHKRSRPTTRSGRDPAGSRRVAKLKKPLCSRRVKHFRDFRSESVELDTPIFFHTITSNHPRYGKYGCSTSFAVNAALQELLPVLAKKSATDMQRVKKFSKRERKK